MLNGMARTLLSAAMLVVPVTALAADIIPVEDFARHVPTSHPSLSPDGRYIAVRLDDNEANAHSPVIYSVDNMQQPVSVLRMPKYDLPLGITWVAPTRLVIAKGRQSGPLDTPTFYGELLATDVDGKHQDYLFGYDSTGSRGSTRSTDKGWGYVVGRPELANGHFYMSTESWGDRGKFTLYDVDAMKNVRRLIGQIDASGMDFMIGADGLAHFAYGDNANFDYVVYHREGSGWSKLSASQVGGRFISITHAPDKQRIYAYDDAGGGPAKAGEGHGFYDEKNVVAFYTTLEAFLDKHIGRAAGDATPVAP